MTELKPKTGRGGRRCGAGRKLGSGEGLSERLQVCVTPEQKQTFASSGGACWLRRLLDEERPIRVVPEDSMQNLMPPLSYFPALNLPRRSVSIFSQAQSGALRAAFDHADVDFNELLAPPPEASMIFQVTSDTMLDAGIHPGDLLVVDRTEKPYSGQIVLVRISGEFSARRVILKDRQLQFHCENKTRSYGVFCPHRGDDWQLVGVVTGLVRKLL